MSRWALKPVIAIRFMAAVAVFATAPALGFVLQAQQPASVELRVRVEAEGNLSSAGLLVRVVDSANSIRSDGLTDDHGVKTFSVQPGTYRVHVLRIGFKPFLSPPYTVGQNTEVRLNPSSERIPLTTMVVRPSGSCASIDDGITDWELVWNDISTALRARQLSDADSTSVRFAVLSQKEFDAKGALRKSDSTVAPVASQRPFHAADPTVLAKSGYVQGDRYKGWQYLGPDEAVLLSPEFAATHCFYLTTDSLRPTDIGVAFKPNPDRKVPDVMGIVWVDRETSELREITYDYALAHLPPSFAASGTTKFQREESGAWVVSEWQLKVPILTAYGARAEQVAAVGSKERRGYLITDTATAGLPAANVPVASASVGDKQASVPLTPKVFGIQGAVKDTAGNPLAATEVTLSTGDVTLSDAKGAFAFSGVPVGPTQVNFLRIGYLPATLAFEGPENVVISLAATMKPVGTQLGTIVVEGKKVDRELAANGFYQRGVTATGTFFTPERMERNSASVSTLLSEIPSVRILGGARGRIPTVAKPDGHRCAMHAFVDGTIYPEVTQVGIDAIVNVSSIKAMEVYKNLDDAPAIVKGRLGTTFIRSQTGMVNCGVILIWTK